MEQLIASVELCNWHKINGQNALVRELFRNRSQQDTAHTTTTKTTTPFSYQFLDAYYSLILRPDTHRGGKDCLHGVSLSIHSFIHSCEQERVNIIVISHCLYGLFIYFDAVQAKGKHTEFLYTAFASVVE